MLPASACALRFSVALHAAGMPHLHSLAALALRRELKFRMVDKLDTSPTAKHGLGFLVGSTQLRSFYACELLDKTQLNYPLVATAQAPLADLSECSEPFGRMVWGASWLRVGPEL